MPPAWRTATATGGPRTARLAGLIGAALLLPAIAAAAAGRGDSSAHAHLQCWEPEPPAEGPPKFSSSKLPPHPRLRVNDSHLAALNRTIQTDATAKAYFEGLVAYGETWLTTSLVDCTAAHMSNTQSRTTLTIQYNLGLLWRLTGDERFAARAAQELLHVTTRGPRLHPDIWGQDRFPPARKRKRARISVEWGEVGQMEHYFCHSPRSRRTVRPGTRTASCWPR